MVVGDEPTDLGTAECLTSVLLAGTGDTGDLLEPEDEDDDDEENEEEVETRLAGACCCCCCCAICDNGTE